MRLPLTQNCPKYCFYGQDINDDFMARSKATLNGIQEINLFGTGVTDVGLKHLQEVKSLTALRIALANVSPEGLDQLRKALPNVTIAVVGEAGWNFTKPWGGTNAVTTMP